MEDNMFRILFTEFLVRFVLNTYIIYKKCVAVSRPIKKKSSSNIFGLILINNNIHFFVTNMVKVKSKR